MRSFDPLPVLCTPSSLARGPGSSAVFIHVLPPLAALAKGAVRSKAIQRPTHHPHHPSLFSLRLSPGPFNLHRAYEPASFN
jgi:hypothetical protein